MKNSLVGIILFLWYTVVSAQTNNDFIRGVDISFTPQIEALGGKYKVNGSEKDLLDILADNGVNYIRLRIWNNPKDGYCNLSNTLEFAQRIKQKGFKFLLDFHYSDWWADPGKQNKPAAWANISFDALKDSVYSYSKFVIEALKNRNALPDMVQVGNEITGGMLWPDGKIYGVGNESTQWVKFAELVKKGIAGVKEGAAPDSTRVMIHIDKGGSNNGAVYFYDHLIAQGISFDVIGLSYYPWWHGTLDQLKYNLNDLSLRYKKDIIVVETAYPNNNVVLNDGMPNVSFDPDKLIKGYTVSVGGQKDFVVAVTKIISDTPGGRGAGLFYWEPAYISVPPIGSSWEYYTLFNPVSGEALSSLSAFKDQNNLKPVMVKVRLNTSTHADTLKSSGFVQIVGQINGTGTNFLPSGERLTWDNNSGLILKNRDGDNWEYEFEMYPDDQIEFKFWTGHAKGLPTRPRLGWEGPITPFDGSVKNARLFNAGFEDTTLDIQYYNSGNDFIPQYASPLEHKEDSVAVLFRVNTARLKKSGLFFADSDNYITLRGDSLNSAGVLSWASNALRLHNENYIYSDSSFWSGVVYFPKNIISVGTKIKYGFYAENSSFGGRETGISQREFSFPKGDTTLAWKFFNDGKTITATSENGRPIRLEFRLMQNYPNPFNPETKIKFSIPMSVETTLPIGQAGRRVVSTTLRVYDILGRDVATLVNENKSPGNYEVTFDGKNLASGFYIYRLTAGSFSASRKMLLMK